MQMIAAILVMFLTAQDKPVPPLPTAEQKTEKPAPVMLPEAKPVQLKITDGSAPALETTRPATTQILWGEGKTMGVRLSAEQMQQMITEKLSQTSSVNSSIVFENGAVYIKTAGFTIPMSGGGASGCLGAASRGKITFHDEVMQRLMESEKPATPDKKE
jgi:hypothetical protein